MTPTEASVDIEARLSRLIDRRRARLADAPSKDRARSVERARLFTELPRFVSRLSHAIAEMNDRVEPERMHLVLQAGGRSPEAEAIYIVGVAGDADEGGDLVISVDYSGKLSAVLRGEPVQAVIRATDVSKVDTAMLTDAMLTLLEARYG